MSESRTRVGAGFGRPARSQDATAPDAIPLRRAARVSCARGDGESRLDPLAGRAAKAPVTARQPRRWLVTPACSGRMNPAGACGRAIFSSSGLANSVDRDNTPVMQIGHVKVQPTAPAVDATAAAPGPAPARSNSSLALDRLRRLLDAGDHGADGQLPTERELAERFGVGRRAVRRALDVLEIEGRVWRRQGSGTFVGPGPGFSRLSSLDPIRLLTAKTNMLEVMEVRLRIEPAIAQLAAIRAAADRVERLRRLAARIADSRDADGRELWDSAFHRTIAEMAGNTLFLALFDVVDQVRQEDAWRHIREAARSQNQLALYNRQHAAIVTALADRNPGAADAAMREHLLALTGSLTPQAGGVPSDAA